MPTDPVIRGPDESEGHALQVAKAEIIASLRSRGLHARADWVDRELPQFVDAHKNGSLLRMLGIDPDAIPPADDAAMAPTNVDG